MKSVYIVANSDVMQTAWFDKKSAIQQATKTNKEERPIAEEAGEEFDGYTIVEMAIQDTASPDLQFPDAWWMFHGGPAVTKVENAAKVIADKAGVDILTALDYIRDVIKDRIS